MQLFPEAGFLGYPLVFDINLNAQAADRRLQYLIDGSYIDNATRSITVSLVTYNGMPHDSDPWPYPWTLKCQPSATGGLFPQRATTACGSFLVGRATMGAAPR